VLAAAFVAAALFPDDEVGGRVVVMAIMVGVYAAMVAELKAVVVVTGLAGLVFIGCVLLLLGAVLGRAQRWMRSPRPDHAS
jgi:hypothetical protein